MTKRPKRLAVLALICVATLVVPTVAEGAPGDLDPSFGDGGKVTTYFCGHDRAFSVAIDSHRRIVAVGTNNLWSDFCLLRFRPNGGLDPSFGDDGTVTTDFGTNEERPLSMTLDPQGRIVAAGRSRRDFAVARWGPNGSVDTLFGNGGEVTTTIGDRAIAHSVAIDSEGRIVVAGTSDFEESVLARYLPDGTPDSSFGTGGVLTTGFGTGADAVAIDSKDRIVYAGHHRDTFALARYKPDGDLDPSFGEGGEVVAGPRGTIYSIAIRPHGRIVAAGSGAGFALARYRPNGELDDSFSDDGKVTTVIGRAAWANTVAIDSRRRIVAVGTSLKGHGGVTDRYSLARYRPNGRLDRSFSENGKVTSDVRGVATSGAIDSRDRIVVAGDHSKLAIARFIGYRRR